MDSAMMEGATDLAVASEGELTATERAIVRGEELGWEQLVEEARRRGPDPRYADLTDSQLETEVGRVAAEIAARTACWLGLLGELIVRGVWADQGFKTPGTWLSYRLGTAPPTAREHARVALRLRDLPKVAERFAQGTLSYSKVRSIAKLSLSVDDEDQLLEWADHASGAQIETIARAVGKVRRLRDGEHRDGEDTRYRWSVQPRADGTAELTIAGPVEQIAELAQLTDLLAAQVVSDRNAGATEAAASVPEAAADDPEGSGDDLASDRAPSPRVSPEDRVDALGHALAAAVASDLPVDTSGLDRTTMVLQLEAAELAVAPEDGPDVVPVRSADGRVRGMDRRKLHYYACEAGLVGVARGRGRGPVDVGRRTRRTTAALRRALHLRDGSCRFPGCGATRHLHAHHVAPWSKDGPTDLDNLVLICAFHHRFVHRHDWHIEVRAGGRHRFTAPGSAEPMPAAGRLPGDAAASLRAAPEPQDPDGLKPPGPVDLGPFDLDTAIHILVQHDERRRAAAAA